MAQSILINLHSKGSCGIVTTHIDTLKEMADTTPEIQNAAYGYLTRTKLEPSFQMKVGVPGNCLLFEIAQERILKNHTRSKKFSGKERISLEERISDFEKYRQNCNKNARSKCC